MTNGELDELLVRHEPALRRLAASYERDPALREDLVQEMLLALFRARPAWRLDALCRDPEPPDAPGPPGDGGADFGTPVT